LRAPNPLLAYMFRYRSVTQCHVTSRNGFIGVQRRKQNNSVEVLVIN
jgi:hypothetical protein